MSKKYKYFLPLCLITVFFFFFLISFSFVGAVAENLEVELPTTFTRKIPLLPEYIQYIFKLVMQIAGALALIVLIYGAVRYIISAGDPEKMGDAKKRMIAAILGLALLLSSYLIIININPEIEKIVLSPEHIKKFPGIYFGDSFTSEQATIKMPAYDTSDTSTLNPKFTHIFYDCEDFTPLLIYIFSEKNFEKISATYKMECGQNRPITALDKSFQIKYQEHGVYLYNKDCRDQTGLPRSYVIKNSQPNLNEEKKLGIEMKEGSCVEIINDPDNKIFYGVILHGEKDYKEICSRPILDIQNERQIRIIDLDPAIGYREYESMTVFRWEPDKTKGSFVKFYSHEWGERGKGGVDKITNDKIHRPWVGYGYLRARDITFDYTGIPISEKEKAKCPNFEKCHKGSIEISGSTLIGKKEYSLGNYLVVLYGEVSGYPIENTLFCIVHKTNVPDLSDERHTGSRMMFKDDTIEIYIIPFNDI